MSRCNATGRLLAERKAWRKDHPHGFVAKPETDADGFVKMMVWRCTIPGKPNTDWEGGYFPVALYFSEDYPITPPKCRFPPGFFHPNVYPSGTVCLSMLDEVHDWRTSLTVKKILVVVQYLLHNPYRYNAAQSECFQILYEQPDEYRRRVREQARRYPLRFDVTSL